MAGVLTGSIGQGSMFHFVRNYSWPRSIDTPGDTDSGRVIVFDGRWYAPGCLESCLCRSLRATRLVPKGVTYLGVPWSRWIDRLRINPSATPAFRKMFDEFAAAVALKHGRTTITACHHPCAMEHLPLFEACGVTELFWFGDTGDFIATPENRRLSIHGCGSARRAGACSIASAPFDVLHHRFLELAAGTHSGSDVPARCADQFAIRQPRHPLRVYLTGLRGKRTPISYAPLRPFALSRVRYVDEPDEADLIVTGFNLDFTENAEEMLALAQRHPGLRFAVLSEEPLWDTTWSGGFLERERTLEHDGRSLCYTMLTHANSSIFEFDRVPYFVLTDDAYSVRYRRLISHFTEYSPSRLLSHWRDATIDTAFVAEKREHDIFRGAFPEHGIARLSAYRTDIARLCQGANVLRLGKGWSGQPPRQNLPDWHLDKLERLHGKTRVLSAIENTHQRCYITEKIFDAFAVGAVPVYHAAPDHRVFELVSPDAMINTWGDSAETASERIAAFKPTRRMAKAWLETARSLTTLFGNTELIAAERARVVNRSLSELQTGFGASEPLEAG